MQNLSRATLFGFTLFIFGFIFMQPASATRTDTLCHETCRAINPTKCKVYAQKDPYGFGPKYHIKDFTNPKKPVDIIDMCGARLSEAKAALGWLRKHKITRQCELSGYFDLPHLRYYLSGNKAPVTRCRPSSDVIGNVVTLQGYHLPELHCDTLPELELDKDRDVKVNERNNDGDKYQSVSFYNDAFKFSAQPEEVQRFFCLMEKYQWNTMGFFFQTQMSHKGFGTFFMHYEKPK